MEMPVVLVLAPAGRNATVAASLLRATDCEVEICTDLQDVMARIEKAHCFLVTEEALLNGDRTEFAAWMDGQPAWSDFPIVILTVRGSPVDTRLSFLDQHAVALERPFQPSTLVNAVRAAVRARRRQLEVKAYIDETLELNQRQKLLIRELHHRVKNTLSNVQAMMRATAHTSKNIDSFLSDFSARIVSLAETHNMLTDDYWQTASLALMLGKQLEHYDVAEGNRVLIEGPEVQLVADLAVPLGMAIHELASNSSRYGCLSRPEGRLAVTWTTVADDESGSAVDLNWLERNGPRVEKPSRRGFGTALLEKVLTVQCAASIDLRYEPEGFSCSIRMPLRERRLVPVY